MNNLTTIAIIACCFALAVFAGFSMFSNPNFYRLGFLSYAAIAMPLVILIAFIVDCIREK